LAFLGIQLHSPSLGEITQIHVAVMGMMAQLTLRDLGEKTKRGQLGRILKGKAAGGLAYGYRIAKGDGAEPGDREIVEDQAEIVVRIFHEFADGRSPEKIARQLNREKIPGPGDRPWSNTTIRGQSARGTGLLNNDLYRGVLVWNRCSYIKDPHTGKKVARPNLPEMWEMVEVPQWRIVDDALWIRVKARQEAITRKYRSDAQPENRDVAKRSGNLNATHRPRFLLSGLLVCGCCDGGYTVSGKDRYGCATRRQTGLCDNNRTINRQELEARVLTGLKDRLLEPHLVAEAVAEFHNELKRQKRIEKRERRTRARRLAEVDRKIAKMLAAIEDGMYHPSMKQRLTNLEAERAGLISSDPDDLEDKVESLLHPNLPELYRRKVQELEILLDTDPAGDEAQDLIRSMIDKVVLSPRKSGKGLNATLFGDLAAILNVCAAAKTSAQGNESQTSQLSVVAGACNHLDLQLLALVFAKLTDPR